MRTASSSLSLQALPLLATLLVLGASPPTAASTRSVPGQYPTINAAIAAADNGDQISIAPGTYPEVISFAFRSGLTIKGKGKGAVIVDAGGAPTAFGIGFCSDIRVENVTLRNASTQLAYVSLSADVTFEDCRFEGGGGIGLSSQDGERTEVVDCRFEDNPGGGVLMDSPGSYVGECTFLRCGGGPNLAAIHLLGDLVTADRNVIKNEGVGYGIFLGDWGYEAHFLLVSHNVIRDAGADGILVANADDCMIVDNIIREPADDGIDLQSGCARNSVCGNRITKPASDGIVTGGYKGAYIDNRVKAPGRDGVWSTIHSSQALFFKNRMTKAAEYGFRVQGDEIVFQKNTAKHSGVFDMADLGTDNQQLGNSFGSIAP